jgi:transcriptional regulator with XRE-family HTH domain
MLLLAKNIKFLRKEKHVTQQDIADIMGVSANAVSNYENSKFYPSADTLAKICSYFSIKVDDILFKDLSSNTNQVQEDTVSYQSNIKGNNILVPISTQNDYTKDEIIKKFEFVIIPGIDGNARTFEVYGARMMPSLFPGDYISCTPITNLKDIQPSKIYVVVSKTSGIHVTHLQVEHHHLLCTPANTKDFEQTRIHDSDVKEIWEAQVKITNKIIENKVVVDNSNKKIKGMEEFLRDKFPDFKITE